MKGRSGSVSKAAAAVTAIPGEKIRASGARYLSDVLRLVPGMEVNRSSSTESNVSLRGFNDASSAAQGIMVLIDGHQVYNHFYGNNFFDTLPISVEDIDRIEVIRGPMTLLYGPNAMHGLINIITMPVGSNREPGKSGNFMSFSTKFGTYQSIVSTFRLQTWDEARQAGLNATLVYDDIDQFDPGLSDTRNKLFANLGWRDQIGTDKNHTIGMGVTISDQRFDVLVPSVGGIAPSRFVTDAREATIKGDYKNDTFVIKVSWIGWDANAEADRFYGDVNVDLDTFNLDVQDSFELLDGHYLLFGAGIIHSIFSTADPDVSFGTHDTTLLSAFIQDEIRVTDNVTCVVGARFDRHSEAGSNISPTAAIVYSVSDAHVIRASSSTGIRNPSHRETVFDLPVTVPGFPPLTVGGNPNLVAEKLHSLELAWSGWFLREARDQEKHERAPPAETSPANPLPEKPLGRLKFGISIYYNRLEDLVEFPTNPTSTTIRPMNLVNDEAYGAEIEAKYLYSNSLELFANYSWGVRRSQDTQVYVRLAPKHKGNLGFYYSSGQWRAMCWGTYFGKTEYASNFGVGKNGPVVDDYFLLNGSLHYDATDKLSLFIEAFNAFDDNHREHPEADTYGALVRLGFRVIL